MGPIYRRLTYALPVGLLITTLLTIAWYYLLPAQKTLRFSTGSELGLYTQIGKQIKEVIESEHEHITIKIINSSGSSDNINRIDSGVADLALVQNDAVGGAKVRSIAAIYPEVLHLICNKTAEISNLDDLEGKTINIGPPGSGTEQLATALLDFTETDNEGDTIRHLHFPDALRGLREGTLDGAFFLTGLGASIIEQAIDEKNMAFAPIAAGQHRSERAIAIAQDFANGFRVHYPYVSPSTIPMMAYDRVPKRPVAAMSVDAVFVCSKILEHSLVESITKTLFEKRAVLAQRNPVFSHLDEENAQSRLQFPLQEGAEFYYRRREPGFLAEHAESMGFILTLLLLFWSFSAGARKLFLSKRKNRIDRFYSRIGDINNKLNEITNIAMCMKYQTELNCIRQEASNELIDEQLAADDAFLIYQNMLNGCQDALGRVRLRLEKSS